MDCRKMIGFIYAWLRYGTNRWRVKSQHRAKADSSQLSVVNEQKTFSERRFIWWEKRMNERGAGIPIIDRYILFVMHFDPIKC